MASIRRDALATAEERRRSFRRQRSRRVSSVLVVDRRCLWRRRICLADALAPALRLHGLVIEKTIDESLEARYPLAKVLPVINDDLWVGMFLINAPASSREAFCADVWVVGLEDAPDLAATA